MILSKKIFIKRRGNKNLKYYSDLGYDTSLDEFEIDIKHLTSNSKYLVDIECDFCKSSVKRMYYLYLKNISSNGLFACSPKCGKNKSINTNLKKWGTEYPNQSELIKNKKIKTNLEKWGVKYPLMNDEIKSKVKSNNLKKWGVEWTLQNKEIRQNIKETNLKKWGFTHNFMVPEIIEKRKLTYLKNWGVDNPSKSEEIKDRKIETLIKNWGVDNPLKSQEIKNKIKETNLKKWGVEYVLSNEEIRNKSKKTLIYKWGVDHNMKSSIIIEKMKKNNLEKWGVEWTLQNDEIRHNIINTNLENIGIEHYSKYEEFRKNRMIISKDDNYIKYISNNISLFVCNEGHSFEISSSNYFSIKRSNLPLCTICNPIGDSHSIKEKELFEYIQSIYSGKIIQSHRDGLEIDIYLPEVKLGFEFNGLYWHSSKFKEKKYHLDKTNYFKERGISIIHIWEDDWTFKKNIIKSHINNLLNLSERIFARKCEVREVKDTKIVSKFLNENHIQGKVNSSLKIGLFFGDELVSLMTFDNFEGRKKMELGGWNINRFCNKIGFNVIGGASKLISFFIKNHYVKKIVSYADRDWSRGDLYYKLGFVNVGSNGPDYKYIVDFKRVHKSRYRKSRLKTDLTESKQMELNGVDKIWDCGKIKFELLIN
jgi:hypothetical protein